MCEFRAFNNNPQSAASALLAYTHWTGLLLRLANILIASDSECYYMQARRATVTTSPGRAAFHTLYRENLLPTLIQFGNLSR